MFNLTIFSINDCGRFITFDLNHLSKLKDYLEKDKIEMIDNGTKATFDGPFTLPILRRNEAMIKIKWN